MIIQILFIMKNKFLVFAALLSNGIFIGCNNETINDSSAAIAITVAATVINTQIDATVDDVANIAEDQFDIQKSKVAKISTPIKGLLPLCATVTSVLANETWTRTVDFGSQGCAMPNGNVLKGKIIISFSKDFATPIRTINYKLEGFYHNDKLVEGSKTIVYELKTSDFLKEIHPVTTHSIDVKVTTKDGTTYTRTGRRVREMLEGFATIANWEDNVFFVLGNHITTFPNGLKYSYDIKNPLRIALNCKMPFPIKGTAEITKKTIKPS